MAISWSTADREGVGHGIKVLVYGRAGMGKTTLCATAPAPLIISAEAGLLSIRKSKADYGRGEESLRIAVVATDKDVEEVLTWCRSGAAKKSGIQTICLDSISEIAEKVLVAEKGKTKDPRQAYGELSTRCIQMVKDFRDLAGLHVVVTAKEVNNTDAITNVVRAGPTAPGQQVGPALPYLFDEVFHAATDKDNTGKTYHYLRTRGSFNADAKDRSGALDEIEYPDLKNIFAKILSD